MPGARAIVLTWVLLLGLLALTVAASPRLTGLASLGASLTIAAAKAGLNLWVFMHLRELTGLLRVVALGGLAWFLMLLALGGIAYL